MGEASTMTCVRWRMVLCLLWCLTLCRPLNASVLELTAQEGTVQNVQAALFERLLMFKENATTACELTEGYYGSGEVDYFGDTSGLNQTEQLGALQKAAYYLVVLTHVFSSTGGVFVGTETGRMIGAARQPNNSIRLYLKDPLVSSNAAGVTCLRSYEFQRLNATTNFSAPLSEDCSYDPRSQAWYQQAATTSTLQWTRVADISNISGVVTTNVMLSISNSSGNMKGVATVETTSADLNELCNSVTSALASTSSYVLDRTGAVMGYSERRRPLKSIIAAVNYPDTAVSETASNVLSRVGSWGDLTTYTRMSGVMRWNTRSEVASSVTDEYGMRWIFVAVFEYEDLYQQLPAAVIASACVSVGIVALLSWYVITPLYRIAKGQPDQRHCFEEHRRKGVVVRIVSALLLWGAWGAYNACLTDALKSSAGISVRSTADSAITATRQLVMESATISMLLHYLSLVGINSLDPSLGQDRCSPPLDTNLDSVFWMYLRIFTRVEDIYVGFVTGDFIACRRTSHNSSVPLGPVLAIRDSTTNGYLWDYLLNTTTMKRTGEPIYKSSRQVDARTRPWFSDGKGAHYRGLNREWTGIYKYLGQTHVLGVTNVSPWWTSLAQDQQFLGVFAVDLALERVAWVLRNHTRMGDHQAFVNNEKAETIGTSSTQPLESIVPIYAFPDAAIANPSQEIAGWFGYNWTQARGYRQDNTDPILHVLQVADSWGLDWTQTMSASYDFYFHTGKSSLHLTFVIVAMLFALLSYLLLRFDDYTRKFEGDRNTNEDRSPQKDKEEKQKVAGKVLHRTMRVMKTKMNDQFTNMIQRSAQAVEYLTMAQEVGDAGIATMIVGNYYSPSNQREATANTAPGRDPVGFRLYRIMHGKLWKRGILLLTWLFVSFEFWSTGHDIVIQAIILAVLFANGALKLRHKRIIQTAFHLKPSLFNTAYLGSVVLAAVALVADAVGAATPLRFVRPLPLILRSSTVQRAASHFCGTLYTSSSVFFLYICTILLWSVFALQLFRPENPDLEQGYQSFGKNFLDAIHNVFILQATAENYADIIPILEYGTQWYFLFFLVATVVGMFFLTPAVIATFQTQYVKDLQSLELASIRRRFQRMAPIFCLWTYQMDGASLKDLEGDDVSNHTRTLDRLQITREAFGHLMECYWDHSSQEGILWKLCRVRQRSELLTRELNRAKLQVKSQDIEGARQINPLFGSMDNQKPDHPPSESAFLEDSLMAAASSSRVSIEQTVQAMQLTDITNEELDRMRNTMLEYSGRIFKLLDTNDSDSVDFMEFEEILMYLKLMPELHFNEVFYREMQRRHVQEVIRTKTEEVKSLRHQSESRKSLTAELERLNASTRRLDFAIEKAKIVAQDTFWGLPEHLADKLMTVYTLAQITALALIGTKHGMSTDLAVAFAAGHIIDITGRVATIHCSTRLEPYWHSESPRIQFNRRHTVRLVIVSAIGLCLYPVVKASGAIFSQHVQNTCFMVMNVGILRFLFLVDESSQLLLSMRSGMTPLTTYSVLLFIIIYEFSVLGYALFTKGGWTGIDVPSHDELEYFSTPLRSLFTMFQLLVGENWYGVMDWTAQYTDKLSYFFFIIYVFLVGVLFKSLFVGMMIRVFLDTEKKRYEGGDMFVILSNVCPGKDIPGIHRLVAGLMTTSISLEDYGKTYTEHVVQIKSIQSAWRRRINRKRFTMLQQEMHPICALEVRCKNGKYEPSPDWDRHLSRIPVSLTHVKNAIAKVDTWIEQHRFISVIYKRFNYFTCLTDTRLHNGKQVLELTAFLAAQLGLVQDSIAASMDLSSTFSVASMMIAVIKEGNLCVLVDKLKETGIDLSGPGNRRLSASEVSTVESDLYNAAEASSLKHKASKSGFRLSASNIQGVAAFKLSNEHPMNAEHSVKSPRKYENSEDTNVVEAEDQDKFRTWQQLFLYTTQAATGDWWNPESNYRLHGVQISDEDIPQAATRKYDHKTKSMHCYDFTPELRQRINTAVVLLDRLCMIVRLRALLTCRNFGEPWEFLDFARWFVEVFSTPILKETLCATGPGSMASLRSHSHRECQSPHHRHNRRKVQDNTVTI